MNLDRCDKCNAEIRWIVTPKGKLMPLDPQPGTLGNVVIDRYDDKTHKEFGHVLKKDEDPELPRFVPHFATCPERQR